MADVVQFLNRPKCTRAKYFARKSESTNYNDDDDDNNNDNNNNLM